MSLIRCCLGVLLVCILTVPIRAVTLWQLGIANDSSAEFADYAKAPAALALPADAESPAIPKGLRGDINPSLDISFDLAGLPPHGLVFSFKLLHAPRSGAQLAVFSNRLFAGLIQPWGTQGTSSPYHWKKTYRLYIPREMLHAGRNTLHLETARPLWSDPSGDRQIWWEWDYLRLEALDAPASEPIHGANTSEHARAGVCIRASTAPNAAMAILALTPGKGCGFTHRDRDDGDCAVTGGAAHPWLRITRSGDTIRGEVSKDGATWKPFGSAKVELPPEALLGLAVCSHHNGLLNRAMFCNIVVQQER